eukprot:COSAG02_NODE_42201_length_386_cov_1.843206_1_plen_74_part_01
MRNGSANPHFHESPCAGGGRAVISALMAAMGTMYGDGAPAASTVHLPSSDISLGIFSSDGTRPIHFRNRGSVRI